jgi:hypothetical protein
MAVAQAELLGDLLDGRTPAGFDPRKTAAASHALRGKRVP